MAWALTSKRKIFGGPDRDETASDKRNLAMYICKFTHSGAYVDGGGDVVTGLSDTFQDIHCAFQVATQAGGTAVNDAAFGAAAWQPVITSKTSIAFKGHKYEDTSYEEVDETTNTTVIDVLVIGLPAVTVPSSVDSVDAFA